MIFLVLIIFVGFFNINCFGFQTHIFSIAISDKTLSGNNTSGSGITKSVKDEVIILFKYFFAEINIELLVLSVRNIDLIGLNLLELSVFRGDSSFLLHSFNLIYIII